jgi:platelet-activating factor acetylhydrolase
MLLEHPTGPYDVGAMTFTLPVRPTEVIGKATVRTETGQITPALRLEEVSFTAYYPASPTTKKEKWRWLNWLPRYVLHCVFEAQTKITSARRPVAEAVRGYSRFTGEPRPRHHTMAHSSCQSRSF